MTIYATILLSKIAAACEDVVIVVPKYYQYAIDLLESDQRFLPPDASSKVRVDVKKLMQLLSKCHNILFHDDLVEILLRQSDTKTYYHYLILTLTILGNMAEPQQFVKEFNTILTKFNSKEYPDCVLRLLSECNLLADKIFALTESSLNQFYPYMRGLSQIIFNNIKVDFVPRSSEIPHTERDSRYSIDNESENAERTQNLMSESESDQKDNSNEDDDVKDNFDEKNY